VTPVALKNTFSPATRSLSSQYLVGIVSCVLSPSVVRRRSVGASLASSCPPMHLIAAAAMIPSGVPPVPMSMSVSRVGPSGRDCPGDVTVCDQSDPSSGIADLPNHISVTRTIEDAHR